MTLLTEIIIAILTGLLIGWLIVAIKDKVTPKN